MNAPVGCLRKIGTDSVQHLWLNTIPGDASTVGLVNPDTILLVTSHPDSIDYVRCLTDDGKLGWILINSLEKSL